jgi:hypothetical protein
MYAQHVQVIVCILNKANLQGAHFEHKPFQPAVHFDHRTLQQAAHFDHRTLQQAAHFDQKQARRALHSGDTFWPTDG